MNMNPDWMDRLDVSITICDSKGVIVYMNSKSAEFYTKYGGFELIGKNMLECHPEPSRTRVQSMLNERTENIYFSKKGENTRLVCQKPVYEGNDFAGIAELIINLPGDMMPPSGV